jgi:hypothetical protein
MIVEKEYRKCSVCNKQDEYENMIMDLREILDCSEQGIQEWESNNPNIDLLSWFCFDCATTVGLEIEFLFFHGQLVEEG